MALWPRPAAPNGDDGRPGRGAEAGQAAYAIQLWAQAHRLALPAGADAAQVKAFDCDRSGCASLGAARPAPATWRSTRTPKSKRLAALCAHADILVTRSPVSSGECRAPLILGPDDFARGGAADVYASPLGWRIDWAQP